LSVDRYDNVVFAGGGNRCLWQAGFWSVAASTLGLAPRHAAAASAGAAVASVVFAGRTDHALARFKRATGANRRNAYPGNVFNGARVFPHYRIYRETLLEVIDATALSRLHRDPHLRVPVTRAPRWLGPRSAVAVAGLADLLDGVGGMRVHQRLAPRIGFSVEYVSVRDCGTPEALADLVLASSCTPPFTPILRQGGRPALDGGIADNVPVRAVPEGPTLVLLTRRYRSLPRDPLRTYVQPSVPVPVSSWDYTDPRGLQAAYDLGRRDGEAWIAQRGR